MGPVDDEHSGAFIMSGYDDFLSSLDDSGTVGEVSLDEILYYGQDSDWGWSRSDYLGLYKLTDNTVLLAAARPGVSLADQDLQILGEVSSDYEPEFLTDYWIALAGWRKGTNGYDSAEGFRVVYSNGDRNGYGDQYWLQTFEFYGDDFHGPSRAIGFPEPLNSSGLSRLEELHEFDINGDGSTGRKGLNSDETPGTSVGLTPGSGNTSTSSPNKPDTSDVQGLLDQLGSIGDSGNQPITINIVNNTNTGSGNITTGDINQGNTYITFTIGTINLNMNKAIYEPGRRSDVVEGTSRDDIIAAGPGKDTLIGGRGDDYFVVGSVDEDVKKKSIDVIKDFRGGDQIVLDDQAYDAIGDDIEVAVTDSKKELKSAAKDDASIIYDQGKGKLFYDANGDKKGFGNAGGQILKLQGKPELEEDDFSYLDEKAESIDELIDAGVDSTPSTESSPDPADAAIIPVNEV
ncbi:calcium-binding protein [Synechococcus sp. KORDI-100]|uniref:calcium-binding protein n=1 Tax=Synechococcus sp. KORDI-100 TaxID=1280380 RepID=UPI0012E03F95|nr:calcium-binding protein [Synechococcus sp. KORDI-100]